MGDVPRMVAIQYIKERPRDHNQKNLWLPQNFVAYELSFTVRRAAQARSARIQAKKIRFRQSGFASSNLTKKKESP